MSSLDCVVYKSLKKADTYLFILEKDNFSDVPANLLQALGQLEWVMDLTLTPERKLARGSAAPVIAALQSQGYYLQLPPEITD